MMLEPFAVIGAALTQPHAQSYFAAGTALLFGSVATWTVALCALRSAVRRKQH